MVKVQNSLSILNLNILQKLCISFGKTGNFVQTERVLLFRYLKKDFFILNKTFNTISQKYKNENLDIIVLTEKKVSKGLCSNK